MSFRLCAILHLLLELLNFDAYILFIISCVNRELYFAISTSSNLWKMVCYGATCTICFDSLHTLQLQCDGVSDVSYWRQATREVVAVKRLRRQWGILVETRTFVNVGKPANLSYSKLSSDCDMPTPLSRWKRLMRNVLRCFSRPFRRTTHLTSSGHNFSLVTRDYVGSQLFAILDAYLAPLGALFLCPPSCPPLHLHPPHTDNEVGTLLRVSSWRQLDRRLLILGMRKLYWVVDMISAVGGFEDTTSDVRDAIGTVSWFACLIGPRQNLTRSALDAHAARLVVVAVRFLPGGKVAKLAGITNCRKEHAFRQEVLNALL